MQEDGYREGAVKTFFDYASLLDERDITSHPLKKTFNRIVDLETKIGLV